jgi:ubiquinone/menaquinone biosynthesis C-methylase UbiE
VGQADIRSLLHADGVSRMIAAMQLPFEGARILEPACGTGGTVIATAKAMRDGGLDPTTCTSELSTVQDRTGKRRAGHLAACGARSPRFTVHRDQG